MILGAHQREDVYLDRRDRNVQGYSYLEGKRVRRKLCSFKDAGLDESGNPIKEGPREEKRRGAYFRVVFGARRLT